MSVLIVCIALVLLVVSGKFRQALYARFVFEIIALMCLRFPVHRFSSHLHTASLALRRRVVSREGSVQPPTYRLAP